MINTSILVPEMSDTRPFLAPRLTGQRFNDHLIPIDILEDLSALQSLIFEVAKDIYLEEHPDELKPPKELTDNVSLSLKSIDQGSAIPQIVLISAFAVTSSNRSDFELSKSYLERSRDRVITMIREAREKELGEAVIDQKYMAYYKKIGQHLKSDEAITFSNSTSSAVLDKGVRKKILSSRSIYLDDMVVTATIPALDKDKRKFILAFNGKRFSFSLDKGFKTTVLTAFEQYESETLVDVKFKGIFNSRRTLIGIESIESMVVLNPLNVTNRLEELGELSDDWYDQTSLAPNKEALKEFGFIFNAFFHSVLPLPHIFPTPEGNIQLEWADLNGHGVIVEVNLSDFSAAVWDTKNGDLVDEININLKNQDEWNQLNMKFYNLLDES